MSPWRALGSHWRQATSLLALLALCLSFSSFLVWGKKEESWSCSEHPSLWGRGVAAWAGRAGAWAGQAVRGAAWRRWPLLGWQVMEAGIWEEGLLGMGVICTKAYA